MNGWWMPLWWRWLFDDFVLWHFGAGARDVFVVVWFGWDGCGSFEFSIEVMKLIIIYWNEIGKICHITFRFRVILSWFEIIEVLFWESSSIWIQCKASVRFWSCGRIILDKGDYQKNCMQCLCPNSYRIYQLEFLSYIFFISKATLD